MEPCTIHNARTRGRDFEAIFEKLARLQGMLARKIPISGQYRGSEFRPIDSELDWQLIDRTGKVSFLDTKSFQGDRYCRSFFPDHQVRTARALNEWGVTAGFCVWFRKVDKVVFFTGRQIYDAQFGSFTPEDGVELGSGFDFDLKKLFQ